MRNKLLDETLRKIPHLYHDDVQGSIIVDPDQLKASIQDLLQRERLQSQEAHSEVRLQFARHAFLIGLLFGLVFGVTLGMLL